MKKSLIIVLFIFVFKAASAQYHEIGGGLGFSNTRTDFGGIAPLSTRFGGTAFYRFNFNEVWVFRTDLNIARFASADKYYNNLQAELRRQSFFTNFVQFGLNMEYNFLNFRAQNKYRHVFSTFLTAGLANSVFFAQSQNRGISAFNISIPFGLGAKYQISKQWNVGLIYLAHKYFVDKIDNIPNNAPPFNSSKVQNPDITTQDWLHTLNFTVSYTIYKLRCPEHFEGEVPSFWQRGFR